MSICVGAFWGSWETSVVNLVSLIWLAYASEGQSQRGLAAHQPLVSDWTYLLSSRLVSGPLWESHDEAGQSSEVTFFVWTWLSQLWFWNMLLKEKLSFKETRKAPLLQVVRQPLLASRNLEIWHCLAERGLCVGQKLLLSDALSLLSCLITSGPFSAFIL